MTHYRRRFVLPGLAPVLLSCVSTQLGSTSLRGAEDVTTTKALPIGKGLVSKADSTRLNVNTVVVERCRVMIMDRVTLASPRAGVLDTVGLREGDTVKHSQVVASLDSSIARAQLAIAKLKSQSTVDIRFANEAIELSRVEYERALKANGKIDGAALFTEFDLRRLKLAVDKAVLMKEQAERESQVLSLTVTQLEAELKTYSVEAPFAGIVTRVHRNKGEAVTLGEPIIEVVNLDRIRVEGFVPARDGLRLKRGLPVTVRLDLPDADLPETQRELNGRLANVDVGVEPVSGQIRISAEVPNPDGLLRAGLLTRLTVLVSEPIIEQTAGQTNDPRLK